MARKDPDLLTRRSDTPPDDKPERSTSFWIVAFAFLIVMAFATLPSPLYGIYKVRDDLSSLTITRPRTQAKREGLSLTSENTEESSGGETRTLNLAAAQDDHSEQHELE